MSSISVWRSRVDVLEHRRVVRRAALGREHVHLPGIVVQLDPRRGGDRLALVDETMHEVSEITGLLLLREVEVVRQPRQRGRRVDGCVEDQLRPLRGTQVGQRLGLQARSDDRVRDVADDVERRVLVRAEPRLGVEDVLDVRVGVPRAAHERHPGHDRPGTVRADDLLRADAVQARSRRSRPGRGPRAPLPRLRDLTPSSPRSRPRTAGARRDRRSPGSRRGARSFRSPADPPRSARLHVRGVA